ncbi:uncharacterized protein METZ01_LOCUS350443, partial [marine metagenome]
PMVIRVLSNKSLVINSPFYYKTALMEASGHAGYSPLFLLDSLPGILQAVFLLPL